MRRNGCRGKVRHKSFGAAVAAVKNVNNAGLDIYKCRVCGFFHLGTSSKLHKIQARIDQLLKEKKSEVREQLPRRNGEAVHVSTAEPEGVPTMQVPGLREDLGDQHVREASTAGSNHEEGAAGGMVCQRGEEAPLSGACRQPEAVQHDQDVGASTGPCDPAP